MVTMTRNESPARVLQIYRAVINALRKRRRVRSAWMDMAGQFGAMEESQPQDDAFVSLRADLLFAQRLLEIASRAGDAGEGQIDFLISELDKEFRLAHALVAPERRTGEFPDPGRPETWLMLTSNVAPDAETDRVGTCLCGATGRIESAGYTRFVDGCTVRYCRHCGDEIGRHRPD